MNWNAVIRTGIKMLKLKQELKISNLFLWGSVGLEGKMNDERMISQTPTVHKLDEVSSWCLVDCLKYVRESVKKSECGLWCWLVLPAARKQRERMCALSCWMACPARKACMEEGERMLPRLFMVAREKMAWNILTVKIFLCQTIIWNSFCYILINV